MNLRTARLNPLGVSANSKADLKRNVTDKISAQNVAEYMIAHPEKVSYQAEDHLASLKKQWGFIQMLTKQKTQLLNQLESLLYTANPELLTYCKYGMSEWVLKLLIRYPTADKLSKAELSSVARIPYISSNRAQELVANARKSIAFSKDKAIAQLIITIVKQILHLKEVIKSQTNIMAQGCSLPGVDLLKTFTGISDFSAIGYNPSNTERGKIFFCEKLASFFVLHPVFKTSGDGSSGFRMSKRGRKEPRQILFMVAFSSIQSNPLISNIYSEHVQRGMNKMAAIGMCMHKILRIIYGMLKHNTAFDPEIDSQNREKTTRRKKPSSRDKNRRYQNFDPKAPISRRQKRKRKEQE